MRFAGAQRVPDKRVELFQQKKFLSPDECAGLIALIDTLRRPSTITDAYGASDDFRTSETADCGAADCTLTRSIAGCHREGEGTGGNGCHDLLHGGFPVVERAVGPAVVSLTLRCRQLL